MFRDNPTYPTETEDVGQFYKEFLEPSFQDLVEIKILVAYFSVQGFSEIFKGLQNIYKNEGKVSLLIGLNNRPDREILEAGLKEITDEEVNIFNSTFINDLGQLKNLTDQYRIALFAFLLKKGLLEVKFAKMIDERAEFHPKLYILKDLNDDYVTSAGSTNLTYRGTRTNFEWDNIRVSWEQGRESSGVESTIKKFKDIWSGNRDSFVIRELDKEFASEILEKLDIADTDEEFLKIIDYLNQDNISDKEIFQTLNKAPIFSEFSLGNVALYPHQSSVFQKAINMWPIKHLFSDEVGLGKTLEVGAVISYLLRYKKVSRILILPPAGLVENWQQEMKESFDLDFQKYDIKERAWTDYDNKITNPEKMTKPYKYSNNIPNLAIVSIDLVGKTDDHFFLNVKETPELIVVDEAHHVRKTREMNGTEPRKLYKFIEHIKDDVPHILFATATPMSKQVEEYYYLLDLLGINQFISESEFKKILKFLADEGAGGNLNLIRDLATIVLKLKSSINKNNFRLTKENLDELNNLSEENIVNVETLQNPNLEKALLEFFIFNSASSFYTSRNMRGVLKRFPASYKFPERIMHGELVEVDPESDVSNLLFKILEFVQNELGKTEEIRFERKNVSGLVRSFYQQRFWSSFYAARKSLYNRKDILNEHINDMENIEGSFIFDDSEGVSIFVENSEQNGLSKEDRKKVIRTAEFELESLEDLIQIAEKIIPHDELELAIFDPKIKTLIQILEKQLEKQKTVILFSRYTDTLDFIERTLKVLLKNDLKNYAIFTGDKREYISNGSTESNLSRKQIREKLDNGEIQLLLCSEAASEGLNLQSASVMVNIDVPWVPTRLEQRIGRIDRLGQKEDQIEIYNIYYPNTYEQEMYEKLFRRQQDINFTLGPFSAIMSEDIKQTLYIEDLKEFQIVTAKYNEMKEEDSFIGLQKLWEGNNQIKEYGEVLRQSLLNFIKRNNPNTILESDSGAKFPVTLASNELKEAIRNHTFNIEELSSYSLIMVDSNMWGMSKNISNKEYLVNPDKILEILFNEYKEDDLFNEINEELTLREIINLYDENKVVLSIPKHYYFITAKKDDINNYEEKIELIPLNDFI